MKQRPAIPATNFSIERGGKTYFASYTVYAGRVRVIYPTKSSKVIEKSALAGTCAHTTARMLLRELILEAAA
jgi:hypothetical protein